MLSGEILPRRRVTVMEHRQGSRHSTRGLVEIRWCGTRSALGFVADVGSGGMFIASDDAGPAPHNVVNIAVLEEDNTWTWIPGLVVHRHDTGFGIMFSRMDAHALAAVMKLLDRYRSGG